MSRFLCMILGVAALLCSSCSKSEIEKLEKTTAMQNAHIERLNLMQAEKESRLAEATIELEKGRKTAEEAEDKIKTLTDDNLNLKKFMKAASENPKGVVDWFKNLPEEKRKVLEKHYVNEKYIQSEGLDCLFLVLMGRDEIIHQLQSENNFWNEKVPELLSLKERYELVLAKMKREGIDVDKYLEFYK